MKTNELTSKLIRYKTISSNKEENARCISFIESYLKANNIKTKKFYSNGFVSLLAGKKIQRSYSLILNGHIDVVPGNDEQFIPVIRGNRLYGRGTADMKSAVAAMINSLIKTASTCNVGLILTTDEEIGGFNGVNYLLTEQEITANCAFIPDTVAGYKLSLGAKGVAHFKFTAKGKARHGSVPWKGDNAVLKLMRIYNRLSALYAKATKNDTWKTSVNLGKISGGNATNTVPNNAEMHIDIRFPNTHDFKTILKRLQSIVRQENRVHLDTLVNGNPVMVDKSSHGFKSMQNAVKEVTGKSPKLVKENGTSDARFFSKMQIPVVMINPISSKAHVNDEWVDLKRLDEFQAIVERFIVATTGKEF